MGYPNFGKVRTITLPYETDMTAAQYLARYGIDLATIEMYDLVNIALSDVVYPVLAIDKENKVLYMADKAYSYAAGLNEIDSSLIAEVIAEGSIVNAKPIYCHPIMLYDTTNADDTKKFFASCLIFNNSETRFDKDTFTTFLSDLASGYSGRVMLSGGGFDDGTGTIVFASVFYDTDNSRLVFEGVRNGFYAVEYMANLNVATINLIDGVNKIN